VLDKYRLLCYKEFTMLVKNPVSLGDLAKELNVNKSKLAYYVKMGVLKPAAKVGTTNLFEREEAIKKLKSVKNNQAKYGMTLSQFVKHLKSK